MNFVLSKFIRKVYCESWRSVFITFSILDIADMTAEGTFPLGAAVGLPNSSRKKPLTPAHLELPGRDIDPGIGFGILHTKNENSSRKEVVTLTGLLYQY